MKITAVLLLLSVLSGCTNNNLKGMNKSDTTAAAPVLSYLALGDSYTIGEAVSAQESFPVQLAAELSRLGYPAGAPRIIARTGWTTAELAAALQHTPVNADYDLVTLLIGVNNQYRGYSPDTYRTGFAALLQQAAGFAGGRASRVFVVSIPDWGLTPYGKSSGRDTQQIRKEIDAFNAICKAETLQAGANFTDISAVADQAAALPALVAADGLHPSGQMYAGWVKLLAPAIALTLR